MNGETHELKVYIKPGCPWCVSVLGYLKNEGYDFLEIDVIDDPKMFEEMRRISKQTFAPTLTYGSLILPDAGVPETQRWLKQHNIKPR